LTKTPKKKFSLVLRFCLSILILGALFKVMHWPYANQLMLPAVSGILIFYTIRFLLKETKERLDYVKLLLVLTWSLHYLITVFHLFYLPEFVVYIPLILFGWWFIEEGINYFKNSRFKVGSAGKIMFTTFVLMSIGFIIIGALFKIQHWPYGALIFSLGMLLLSFLVIIDYFVRE